MSTRCWRCSPTLIFQWNPNPKNRNPNPMPPTLIYQWNPRYQNPDLMLFSSDMTLPQDDRQVKRKEGETRFCNTTLQYHFIQGNHFYYFIVNTFEVKPSEWKRVRVCMLLRKLIAPGIRWFCSILDAFLYGFCELFIGRSHAWLKWLIEISNINFIWVDEKILKR